MARILVVEDNELSRDMLSRRLKLRGYEVVCAVNGAEALALAASEKPDLILLDLRLPDINGWDLTRMLKAEEETKAIGIIALTAHAMAGHREQALAAGCDEYDTKPVDFERLLGKMVAVMNR
jgi:CheY-like chemotaxis protein